jgi:SAM-dependent methyltransferase
MEYQRLMNWTMTPLKPLYRKVFRPLEAQFQTCFRREIEGSCQSILDVGCGFNSPVQLLEKRPSRVVGVDAFPKVIDQSRARGIHDEYHLMDALAIAERFPPRSFDCVLACDVIEHLKEEDALNLISQMELLARKKVIIYTPNGFLPQGEEYGNPLQRHLSGWTAKQMASRGYRVMGMQGLKYLRCEMARLRWRPVFAWQRISLLSQLLTERWPRFAFRLLCVKDIADRDEA